MNLLFCGSGWHDLVDAIRDRLDPVDTIDVWDRSVLIDAALADVDVALPSNGKIPAHAGPKLKLVQQPAAGFDGIDVAGFAARGIPVCNAPGANAEAVAEAAILLLLSLARRVPEAAIALRKPAIGGPVGVELAGRSLLVVGRGRTGARTAALAEALGMRVTSVGSDTDRTGLHAILGGYDAISLHCPLTPATRGLFDDAAFAAMKPGAWLVNVARGPIIERGALDRALAVGSLGGFGIDVYWREPWDPADPLLARPDVVALPHIAGSTRESFGAIAAIVVANVERLRNGAPLMHRVG